MARKRAHHGAAWSVTDGRRLVSLHGRGISGARIAQTLGRTRAAIYQRLTIEKAKRKRIRR